MWRRMAFKAPAAAAAEELGQAAPVELVRGVRHLGLSAPATIGMRSSHGWSPPWGMKSASGSVRTISSRAGVVARGVQLAAGQIGADETGIDLAVHAAELRLRPEHGLVGCRVGAGKHRLEDFRGARLQRRLIVTQRVVIAHPGAGGGEIVIRRRGERHGHERERREQAEGRRRKDKAPRESLRPSPLVAAGHSGNFRSLVAVASGLPEASSAFTVQR